MKMKNILLLFLFSIITLLQSTAQNDGDIFFGSNNIHEIRLTFAQTSYWDSLVSWKTYADATGENVYISADAVVDGVSYNSIGVRLKGNSSYAMYPGDKKPFKLEFDEFVSGQEIDGLEKISLNNGFNDPTMLREKILLDYSRKHNIAAPRCTFAKLYLNNIYWGLYSVVEQIDKTFLGDYYPENDGNLFKGDPMGKLQWEGATQTNYYDNLELKTNESLNDWSDVIQLMDIINNTPAVNFEDSLNQVFNISEFLRNNAVNLLFVSLDSYVGIGHNYYIYHNLVSDKFEWITWDANGCFGVFNNGMSITQLENLSLLYIKAPSASLPLLDNIRNNTNLRFEYLNDAADFLNDDFDTTYFFPIIDSLADVIRTDLYADTKKMFSNSEFEDNIEYTIVSNGVKQIAPLKGFLAARIPIVITELASFGIYLDTKEIETAEIDCYPNPTQDNIVIEFHQLKPRVEIAIFDILGRIVSSTNYNNVYHLNLNLPSDKGLYFVRIFDGDKQHLFKVIKD